MGGRFFSTNMSEHGFSTHIYIYIPRSGCGHGLTDLRPETGCFWNRGYDNPLNDLTPTRKPTLAQHERYFPLLNFLSRYPILTLRQQHFHILHHRSSAGLWSIGAALSSCKSVENGCLDFISEVFTVFAGSYAFFPFFSFGGPDFLAGRGRTFAWGGCCINISIAVGEGSSA